MKDSLRQHGILDHAAFYDASMFAAEQRVLGERCWVLLGPSEWVSQDGAWMTGRIADREVFVQRFGDRLVGFENVCSHRFSELRGERRGAGAIRCRYHGWMFDSDGVPVGIPHCREMFGVGRRELADRRLRPITLAQTGAFVFGRLPADQPQDLDAGFGRWASLYSALGGRTLELFSEQEQLIQANWKLTFENTLDEYHVAAVHPESFGSGGRLAPGQYLYEEDGTSDAMVLKRAGIQSVDAAQFISALAAGTAWPADYAIFHFFPDLLLAFVAGRVILVTRYEALSVNETRARSLLFDLLPREGKALNEQKRRAVTNYISTVLEEDRVAVERWNRGFRQGWASPLHSVQEQRLGHFERSWSALFAAGDTVGAVRK